MKINIHTMFRTIYSGTAVEVVAPAVDGEISFYENHAPTICPLRRGVLSVFSGEHKRIFEIVNGIIHIYQNKIDVLVQLK